MQDRTANALSAMFGQKPQTRSEQTETVKSVKFTYRDETTRTFEAVSNEEVSLLSMYSLIDDSIVKTEISITYQRPAA